ncbi:hypothetical protein [Thalassobaculum salexigens]|uniref:hypothetical protein n=1 Tax=Thalassobaculum salexigens TaxID=455360 RepID=UPI00248D930B|nr:hypothetical protein [Thalassobaculum salexigens]
MTRVVAPSFDRKLQLIMRVIGAVTHKQLYARLKAINPHTQYVPELAYKWVKAQSSPRNHSVYDDLAALVDLTDRGQPVGGSYLRACDYATFRALMAARYRGQLPKDDGEADGPTHKAGGPAGGGGGSGAEPDESGTADEMAGLSDLPSANAVPPYLAGAYLVLSRSWSALRPTSLLCGELIVRRRQDGRWMATYLERLPAGDMRMSGQIHRIGPSVLNLLVDAEGDNAMPVILSVPPAPGVVLCGVMSGSALQDIDMGPSAGRVVCLKMTHLTRPTGGDAAPGDDDPSAVGFAAGTTYLAASPAAIAERLMTVGVAAGRARRLAAPIGALLTGSAEMGVVSTGNEQIGSLIREILRDDHHPGADKASNDRFPSRVW